MNTAQGVVPAWTIFGPEQRGKRPGGWNSDTEQGTPPAASLQPAARAQVLRYTLPSVLTESLPFCSTSLSLAPFLFPHKRSPWGPGSKPSQVRSAGTFSSPGISPTFWHPPDVGITQVPKKGGLLPHWQLCLRSLPLGGPAALNDSKPCLAAHAPSPKASTSFHVSDALNTPPWQ